MSRDIDKKIFWGGGVDGSLTAWCKCEWIGKPAATALK